MIQTTERYGEVPLASIASLPQIRTRNGFDKESITQLADSIDRHGLLQPLVLRERDAADSGSEDYIIVAGHRRAAALRQLGKQSAQATILSADTARIAYEAQLAENIQREDLTLGDIARAVRSLATETPKPGTLAAMLNKSKPWVSKHLALTKPGFPQPITDAVDEGVTQDLELVLGIAQVWKASPNTGAELLDKLRCGSLSREDVRREVQNFKERKEKPAPVGSEDNKETPEGEGPSAPMDQAAVNIAVAIEIALTNVSGLTELQLTCKAMSHAEEAKLALLKLQDAMNEATEASSTSDAG